MVEGCTGSDDMDETCSIQALLLGPGRAYVSSSTHVVKCCVGGGWKSHYLAGGTDDGVGVGGMEEDMIARPGY